MRTETEIRETLLADPRIVARLKVLDTKKEFLDSISDYRFFDKEMNGGVCAQIQELNAPANAEVMTPEKIRERRVESMLTKQMTAHFEIWDSACFQEAFGFRPVHNGEVGTFPLGKSKEKVMYVGDWNPTNRTPTDGNLEKIGGFVTVGRFVQNGETYIFDWDGHAGSAQHRGWEKFKYLLSNPGQSFLIHVVRGTPTPFVDSLDIGSSRSNVQVVDRDTDFLPAENIKDEFGVTPKSPRDERRRIVDTLNGVLRNTALRSSGKDIHSSVGQFAQTEFTEWLSRFDTATLEQFALVLWNGDKIVGEFKSRKKSIGDLLGGLKRLGALLVLYANRNLTPQIIGDKTKKVIVPDSLSLDVDFVRDFMNDASSTTGFMSEVYTKLATITNDDKRRLVGVSCNSIRWYAGKRVEAVIPAATQVDPVTGQTVTVGEPRLGYQCPVLPWNVADPGVPPTDSTWKWPNLGGLDVGYIGLK